MNKRIPNITTRLGTIMLLVLLPLLVSCSGGDSSSPAKLSARMIGTMPFDLADEINQQFAKANGDSDVPFLIGSVDFNTLSDADRTAIRDAFDYDIPIMMVRPTLERRQALRALVGIDMVDTSTDIPDFWGVQTSRAYEMWEYVSAAPSLRTTTNTTITSYSDAGIATTTGGTDVIDYLFDESDYQLSRVQGVRDWLQAAPERAISSPVLTDTAAKAPVTAQTAAAPKAVAAADPSTYSDIMKIISADTASTNFGYLHNQYAVNMETRSVYQAPSNYFVITARGILSAENEWKATTNDSERDSDYASNRGRVAYQYNIRFYIPGSLIGEVMEDSNTLPKTEEDKEEITNTLGWDLGGKVTGGVECEATEKVKGLEAGCSGKVGAEISGGIKSSISRKFTIRDVSVENKSLPGSPAWLFTIIRPESVYTFPGFQWTKPKKMATSTFQPEMAWVWKVSDTVRARFPKGLPVVVEFQPVLNHRYTVGWAGTTSVTLNPELPFSVQTSFPWPPTTAVKSK